MMSMETLGADVGEAPEGKFLGRLIRFTSRGLEWEADKKQVEGLVNEYGLECGNGVETPHSGDQSTGRVQKGGCTAAASRGSA